MARTADRSPRPARFSRWATSGLTAAVSIGTVAVMAERADDTNDDATGEALGLAARQQGELSAAAMMAAADPGATEPDLTTPSTLGRADVS